jgi:hypothetical protein
LFLSYNLSKSDTINFPICYLKSLLEFLYLFPKIANFRVNNWKEENFSPRRVLPTFFFVCLLYLSSVFISSFSCAMQKVVWIFHIESISAWNFSGNS